MKTVSQLDWQWSVVNNIDIRLCHVDLYVIHTLYVMSTQLLYCIFGFVLRPIHVFFIRG